MILSAAWSAEQWSVLIVAVVGSLAAAVVSIIQALRATRDHTETTERLDDIHVLVNDRLDAALKKIATLETQMRRLPKAKR